MSKWSDIKRAMRPAEMEDYELRGLKEAIDRTMGHVRATGAAPLVKIPSITKAGKAYLLELDVRGGRIFRFAVDHDPDLSSPEFEAYVDKRVEWEAEDATEAPV